MKHLEHEAQLLHSKLDQQEQKRCQKELQTMRTS